MENNNQTQNTAMPAAVNKSKYHPFYLVMLILSTINTVVGIVGLILTAIVVFAVISLLSSSTSYQAPDLGLLDQNGAAIYVIIAAITSLLATTLHTISLVLLYLKKRFAIKVKLATYAFDAVVLIASSIYVLAMGLNQTSSAASSFGFNNFMESSILSNSMSIIPVVGSLFWIIIRAVLWLFASKEQSKHDNAGQASELKLA